MSINGRICNYYQPRCLNGQASWFSSVSPPPWHVKCLKEMVILLGVLFRSGPIQLKDFFLKLWFRSLEVVSLSRTRGLALFPYSWSLCWGGQGGASCHEQHVNWHRLSGINSLLSGVFKVFNSLALSALRFLAPARSPPTVGYHK